MSQIVVERPEGFDPRFQRLALIDACTGSLFRHLDFRLCDVKIKKSKEEKDAMRRLYRREYTKRPNVLQKLRERMMNPLMIKKKKEYAAREDVKERKKILSKRKAIIPAKLKEKAPQIYHEIMSEISGECVPRAASLFDCYGDEQSSSNCESR